MLALHDPSERVYGHGWLWMPWPYFNEPSLHETWQTIVLNPLAYSAYFYTVHAHLGSLDYWSMFSRNLLRYQLPWSSTIRIRNRYTLNSVTSTSLMSLLLLYPKTLGKDVLNGSLTPYWHYALPFITGFDIKVTTKDFKPHACMHYVVIIAIIVNIAILSLH